MKWLFTIGWFFTSLMVVAQTDEEKLTMALKELHQALVTKNTGSINLQTDKALSYGHSNGWVETKADMIKNLETGYVDYHSIKEDSIQVVVSGNMAHARFVGDYKVTVNGNSNTFHLKVLEVWVKKRERWVLFARQAVR